MSSPRSSRIPAPTRRRAPRAQQPGLAQREVPGGNGQAHRRRPGEVLRHGGGARIITRETIAEVARPRVRGIDESFGGPTAFAAGFQIDNPLTGKAAFGHSGWGGSYAFADPAAKLGFAYVTNRMLGFDDGIDPRRKAVIDAVYARLASEQVAS